MPLLACRNARLANLRHEFGSSLHWQRLLIIKYNKPAIA